MISAGQVTSQHSLQGQAGLVCSGKSFFVRGAFCNTICCSSEVTAVKSPALRRVLLDAQHMGVDRDGFWDVFHAQLY